MKLFTIFLMLLLISACAEKHFSAPVCRIAKSERANLVPLLANMQAACVVRMDALLLVIERDNGVYDIAYYDNSLAESEHSEHDIHTLEEGISGQCAAHRSMWIQTGFNVEVGALLTTEHDGTQLYSCRLQAGFDGTEGEINVPPWKPKNVAALKFIQPFDIELQQWHRPDNFVEMRDAFVLSKQVSAIHHINRSD